MTPTTPRLHPGGDDAAWLQAFAKLQPATWMVDALRALMLGSHTAARRATPRPRHAV